MSSPGESHGVDVPSEFIGCISYLLDAKHQSKNPFKPLWKAWKICKQRLRLWFAASPSVVVAAQGFPLVEGWEKIVLLLLILLQGKASEAVFGPLRAAASCFHLNEEGLESLWNARTDWRCSSQVVGKENSAMELPHKKLESFFLQLWKQSASFRDRVERSGLFSCRLEVPVAVCWFRCFLIPIQMCETKTQRSTLDFFVCLQRCSSFFFLEHIALSNFRNWPRN